jgi:hypothetical protein
MDATNHFRQAQKMDEFADIVHICLVVIQILLLKKCIVFQILMQTSVLNCNMEREEALYDLSTSCAYICRCVIAEEHLDHVNREPFSCFMKGKNPYRFMQLGLARNP